MSPTLATENHLQRLAGNADEANLPIGRRALEHLEVPGEQLEGLLGRPVETNGFPVSVIVAERRDGALRLCARTVVDSSGIGGVGIGVGALNAALLACGVVGASAAPFACDAPFA